MVNRIILSIGLLVLFQYAVCANKHNPYEFYNETNWSEDEGTDFLNRNFQEYLTANIKGKAPISQRVKREAPTKLYMDIRQNTNVDVFKQIDAQVNKEYKAMYFYERMSENFYHPNIGKTGFGKFFKNMANEELEHARKFIDYINARGESLENTFRPITPLKLPQQEGDATKAVEAAIKLEMDLNESLLKLHKLAAKHTDPDLQNFLETNYLDEQVKSIRDLRILLSRLTSPNNRKDIAFLIDQEFRMHLK